MNGLPGLSLLEYFLRLLTNLSKSSCLPWRFSRDLRCSSGLYLWLMVSRSRWRVADVSDDTYEEELLFSRRHVPNQRWAAYAECAAAIDLSGWNGCVRRCWSVSYPASILTQVTAFMLAAVRLEALQW